MADTSNQDFPRTFVPKAAVMGDWEQIEPLFDALEKRDLSDAAALEQWILDCSELQACIAEEETTRYVAMTCHTDDPEKEKAYLHFIEEIEPKCKPRWHALKQQYVASPARASLPGERYEVFDRSTESSVALYREENVPLQTEDSKLDQKYQKICGSMTVDYDGREQTLQQMARYQLEIDRAVREDTWKRVVNRRLSERDSIDDIFDQMIRIRTKMARQADLPDFRAYQFKAYERFDYTPEDCIRFHDAIAKIVVPVKRDSQKHRAKVMELSPLRPWDLSVDPKGRPPLHPFDDSATLCDKCRRIFDRLDPELGKQFASMIEQGWLDLDSRKGKAPGGYQATFDETRHPFIFMNAVGLHRDVETLLHEGGHAFHALACRNDPLIAYRHCGMEMAEVASMSMELLASDYLDEFYDAEDLRRARLEQFEGIISIFPWIATIDAFQHWLYTNPDHSRDERIAQWLSLLERFGGIEDWTGYEASREAMWQRQLHLFGVPFYYIEYGIAQIGALQLWQNARQDKQQALRKYREALALGGSRPLPQLWEAAGLRFDFSEDTLQPLISAVVEELDALRDDE